MAVFIFVFVLLYVLLASGLSNAALKSRLEAGLSSWSGLIVRSDGKVELSLFPPKVTLSGVTAESAVPSLELKAKEVSISYSLLSLLTQKPVMQEVDLGSATVVIDGRTPFSFNDFVQMTPLGPVIASAKAAGIDGTLKSQKVLSEAAPGVLRFNDAKVTILFRNGWREEADNLTGVFRWAQIDGPADFSVSGMARGEPARFVAQSDKPLMLLAGFETAVTAQFKSAPFNFDYSGMLAFSDGLFAEGKFGANLHSLGETLAWMNMPAVLSANQDTLSLEANLSQKEGKITLNELEMEFGDSSATGMLMIDPALARTVVSGSLAFESADLGSMVAALEPADQKVKPEIDLDLRISAETLSASSFKLSNAAGTIKVNGNETFLDLGSSQIAGGECIGSFKFSGPPEKRLGTLKLSVKDMMADQMEVYDTSLPLLSAKLSAQFEASGEFYNWKQFVRQANGTLKLDIGEGVARNFSTDMLAGLVSNGAVFSLSDVYAGLTPLAGGSVSGTFSGGAAIINSAALQFAGHYIRLSGAVPLLTGGVALSGKIIPAGDDPDGRLFFVGGAWSRPFVTMGATVQ